MKHLGLILLLAACGPKPTPIGNAGSGSAVEHDTRSPYLQRRDVACRKVATRLVACAVADAKAELDAGSIKQAQYDKDTSADVQAKLAAEWNDTCIKPGTTRQLRVLEVCEREEQACDPLLECLAHLNDKEP
ncbi:MAG: hypothetical protein NT062_16205 [Proteobacteria bacterium]|nr:hypothetical protein [Pseudomonadota bacterium]